jgi:monoamine oxidase
MNKVIIIGGGISGLYAALRFIEQDIPVMLFDTKSRLGGNIYTHYDEKIQLEEGAGRFNKFHKIVMKLIERYGLHMSLNDKKRYFAPIQCPGPTIQDPSEGLLKKVLKYADSISVDILKQITFGQLCEMVLDYKHTKLLIESFGYNAEFLVANAYTSIEIFKEDFNIETEYYSCTEGLSELIKRMGEDLVQKGATIHLSSSLQKFEWKEDHFVVSILDKDTEKTTIYRTEKLVLAMPKRSLLKQDFFQAKQRALLDSVTGVNLHRIYIKYLRNWIRDIYKTTTDLPLRQFIPVDKQNGVAMVSYTDLFDADYWKVYADMGSEKLEAELKKQTKKIFPEKTISKAEWVYSSFWKEAVHCWNAGVDPIKVRKEIAKIHPHLFIVGEAYSLRQGWMEGGLETVEDMFSRMKQKGGFLFQGNNQSSFKEEYPKWVATLPTFTKKDIQRMKEKIRLWNMYI